MNELEKAQERLDKAWKAYDTRMKDYDFEKSTGFRDMERWVAKESEEIALAAQEVRSLKPVEWEEIPEYGDVMTKEHWLACVESGGFIDYDGSGNYATEDKMSNISVSPSHVKRGWLRQDKEFTHIVWFNR